MSGDKLKSDLALAVMFDTLADSYSVADPLHDAIRDIDDQWSNGKLDIPSHLESDQVEDWLLGKAVISLLEEESLYA
jgi:hypothetical protein